MPPRKQRSLVLEDPAAVALVGSPHRLEILASLGESGPATVAALSERLGRSPHSIYFHLRKLEQAGVVRVCATRVIRGQTEKTWDATAERVLLGCVHLEGSAAASGRAADAMLRLTSRELLRALDRAGTEGGAGEGKAIAIRMKGRIAPKDLTRIRALVEEIERIVRARPQRKGGVMHAITVVVTPTPEARRNTSHGRGR